MTSALENYINRILPAGGNVPGRPQGRRERAFPLLGARGREGRPVRGAQRPGGAEGRAAPGPRVWWLQHGARLGAGAAAGIRYLRARQGVGCQEIPSPRQGAEGPVKACRPGPLASCIPLPRAAVFLGAFLLGCVDFSLRTTGLAGRTEVTEDPKNRVP